MSVATYAAKKINGFLTLGKYGAGCGYISMKAAGLGKALRAALEEAKGKVDLSDSLAVNSAMRHEAIALWCLKQLRNNGEKWGPETKLAYVKAIGDATEKRNRAVSVLKLDCVDPLYSILYGTAEPADDPGDDHQPEPAEAVCEMGDLAEGDAPDGGCCVPAGGHDSEHTDDDNAPDANVGDVGGANHEA